MTTVSEALGLPPVEAIDYLRTKTAIPSRTYRDVWRDANARAFTVAGSATQALAADFQAEIVKAAETGTTLREFSKTFDQIAAKHGWSHSGTRDFRAKVIYETNLSTAYAAGRYRQMVEPETLAAFPYWEYVHGGSKHPRHDHLSWNGLVLRCDDPWWSTHYPPNGWGCSCWVRPISARGLARRGKNGPDTAPAIEYRDWTNKTTGKVEQVPRGIDPGWDYNVGQAYLGTGPVKMPADATLRVGRPLGDRLPKPAAETDRPPGVVPASSSLEPAPITPPEGVQKFAADVLAGVIKEPRQKVVVGHIDDAIATALGTSATAVEVDAFRIMKVAGRAEEMGGLPSNRHPEVTPEWWGQLGELIATGEVILVPTDTYRQVVVFGSIGGKQRMVVVRAVDVGGSDRVVIPSYSGSGQRRRDNKMQGARIIRAGK